MKQWKGSKDFLLLCSELVPIRSERLTLFLGGREFKSPWIWCSNNIEVLWGEVFYNSNVKDKPPILYFKYDAGKTFAVSDKMAEQSSRVLDDLRPNL